MNGPFRRTVNERIDAVIDVANVVLGDEPPIELSESELVNRTYRSIRLELTKLQSFGTDGYLERAERERRAGRLDVDITGYVDDGLSDFLDR